MKSITDRQVEMMARPDSELPPPLTHEQIREVRNVSSQCHHGYQIVFDQHFVPYSYRRQLRDGGWELVHARVEWHQRDGLLGFLRRNKSCITVSVMKEAETMPWEDQSE